MNRIGKNYMLNMLSQILRLLTPLVTTPYISRVLGAEGIGIFSYTYSILTYFLLIAALGTASYGSREIARNRENPEKVSYLFWEIETLTVITSLVCIVVWGMLILYDYQYRIYYIILTIFLFASMCDISWFFTGLEMFPYIVAKNITVRIAEMLAIFALIKDEDDLIFYFLIMAMGTFLGNASLWLGVRDKLVKIPFSQLRIFRHFKGTMVFFLPTIATSIYTVLDKTLIGLITKDVVENGCYEQATKIIDIAKTVTCTSLNVVLAPRCAFWFVNREYDRIKEMLHKSLEFMLLIGLGFTFGIAGMAEAFVPWFFGDGFERAIVILKCLTPIICIITISNTLGYQYYDPAGLRLKSAKYLIVGALCNLFLNSILIPIYKATGAAIASVVAEVVISSLYLKNCNGYLGIKFITKVSYKKIISGIVMFIFLQLRMKQIIFDTFEIIVLVLQGMIIYFVMLLILRDSMIKKAFAKLVNKD